MRFLTARPFSYALLGLFLIDLFGAIPFGITDTADTSRDSIGPDEWFISAVMLVLAVMIVVSGVTRKSRLLNWTALVGASLWFGTAIYNTLAFFTGSNDLDFATSAALTSLALGGGVLHLGIKRVAVIPGELDLQLDK
jgi:hypothetical protein